MVNNIKMSGKKHSPKQKQCTIPKHAQGSVLIQSKRGKQQQIWTSTRQVQHAGYRARGWVIIKIQQKSNIHDERIGKNKTKRREQHTTAPPGKSERERERERERASFRSCVLHRLQMASTSRELMEPRCLHVRSCLRRLLLLPNARWQCSQRYGLSPVWMRRWRVIFEELLNALLQSGHMYTRRRSVPGELDGERNDGDGERFRRLGLSALLSTMSRRSSRKEWGEFIMPLSSELPIGVGVGASTYVIWTWGSEDIHSDMVAKGVQCSTISVLIACDTSVIEGRKVHVCSCLISSSIYSLILKSGMRMEYIAEKRVLYIYILKRKKERKERGKKEGRRGRAEGRWVERGWR